MVESGNQSTSSLIFGVLGFIALMALCYFGLKFVSKRNLLAAHGQYMQVIDRMVVSKDCMVLLVRVSGRVLAVGITKEGVHTLCEIEKDQLETILPERKPLFSQKRQPEREPPPQATAPQTGSRPVFRGFWGRFAHNLGVNSGFLPKETPLARPQTNEAAVPRFQELLQQSQTSAIGLSDNAGQPACPTPTQQETMAATDLRAYLELLQTAPMAQHADNRPATPAPAAVWTPPAAPVAPTASAPAPSFSPVVDYNEAIRRMRQYGNLEPTQLVRPTYAPVTMPATAQVAGSDDTAQRDAPAPFQPPVQETPPQNVRAYAAQQVMQTERVRPHPASARQADSIDLLRERVSRRADQIAMKCVQADGKGPV